MFASQNPTWKTENGDKEALFDCAHPVLVLEAVSQERKGIAPIVGKIEISINVKIWIDQLVSVHHLFRQVTSFKNPPSIDHQNDNHWIVWREWLPPARMTSADKAGEYDKSNQYRWEWLIHDQAFKPDRDNIVISQKPHCTCLASRGHYIPVTTNNYVYKWHSRHRTDVREGEIRTQHKKCSRFGHIFVWIRGREVKAKHEKQGHFGRIFHAWNGMGIRQVPKHENAAKLAIFFRVWARVRVKVRSSTKTRPFRPRCSCREWGRDWIETQTREMQPN